MLSKRLVRGPRRWLYHSEWMLALLLLPLTLLAADGDWAQWRGPDWNGVARGDAPIQWSDTEHIKWKAEIPGRGHSSPVVWGDKIFVTTAVSTGAPAPGEPADAARPGRRGFGRGGGPQAEQKFMLLCLDRKTGKLLWERVATVAAPHE